MVQTDDAGNEPAGAEGFKGELAYARVTTPVAFLEVDGLLTTCRDSVFAFYGAMNLELKGG